MSMSPVSYLDEKISAATFVRICNDCGTMIELEELHMKGWRRGSTGQREYHRSHIECHTTVRGLVAEDAPGALNEAGYPTYLMIVLTKEGLNDFVDGVEDMVCDVTMARLRRGLADYIRGRDERRAGFSDARKDAFAQVVGVMQAKQPHLSESRCMDMIETAEIFKMVNDDDLQLVLTALEVVKCRRSANGETDA